MSENERGILPSDEPTSVRVVFDGISYTFNRTPPIMPNQRDRVVVRALLWAAADEIDKMGTPDHE